MIKKGKVVHIIANEKFIKPFIDVIEKNFSIDDHVFIFMYGSSEKDFPIPKQDNIVNINNLFLGKYNIIKLSKIITPYIEVANKVILHSLFSNDLINYLYLNQKFLKKCYWMMWGGDLYSHVLSKKSVINSFSRYRKKTVIKHIAGLITYIKGDFELAKKWYDAKGKYYECLMYPSNLYKEYHYQSKEHNTINIQIGNSADPTNNHLDILEKLEQYKDKNIKIYAPLSYSNKEYAKIVQKKGQEVFGDKFVSILDFMPLDKYLEFLAKIDIAVFAHNRQQAMGNMITLLGLGKKVYMRNDITPWQLFEDINVKVFDVDNMTIDLLDESTMKGNKKRVQEYFSEENYLKQLKTLFES